MWLITFKSCSFRKDWKVVVEDFQGIGFPPICRPLVEPVAYDLPIDDE